MHEEEWEARTEPKGGLLPPGRRPPTAIGAATPMASEHPPPPSRRATGGGLLGLLRRLEIATFGLPRTVGPRPGRTPTL
jgi:hypothetical protein